MGRTERISKSTVRLYDRPLPGEQITYTDFATVSGIPLNSGAISLPSFNKNIEPKYQNLKAKNN